MFKDDYKPPKKMSDGALADKAGWILPDGSGVVAENGTHSKVAGALKTTQNKLQVQRGWIRKASSAGYSMGTNFNNEVLRKEIKSELSTLDKYGHDTIFFDVLGKKGELLEIVEAPLAQLKVLDYNVNKLPKIRELLAKEGV